MAKKISKQDKEFKQFIETDKPKKEDLGVSLWLRIILWVCAILGFLSEYYNNLELTSSSAGALGRSTLVIIGVLIAYSCAVQNAKWANNIKKSSNWAYAIGFVGGLVGLLGYWIYYRAKKKKSKRESKSRRKILKIFAIVFIVFYFIGVAERFLGTSTITISSLLYSGLESGIVGFIISTPVIAIYFFMRKRLKDKKR